MKIEAKITYMETTQNVADHTQGTRVGLKQPKKLPNLQACSRGIWKTKLSFMKNKTCLVAHNYTSSSVNHMYASKMAKEMLL